MPFVAKYMTSFITTNGSALKNIRAFDRQATATAHLQLAQHSPPKKHEAEEVKAKPLTAKEMRDLRKQEEAQKKFDEMKLAARGAYQKMAEYGE